MFEVSLAIYFVIYLWKHSEILKFIREPILRFYDEHDDWLSKKAKYLMNCPFCISFWGLLICHFIGTLSNPTYIITVPLLCLFYDLIYVKLTSEF